MNEEENFFALEAFFSVGFLDLLKVDGLSILSGAFDEVIDWEVVDPIGSVDGRTSFSTLWGFSPQV